MKRLGLIEYTKVDEKTKHALEAVREELRCEYEAKIAELEKRASFGDKVKEHSSFYASWPKTAKLNAFQINSTCELSTRELGRLQEAFLEKFHFYYLFIQGHIPKDQRGRYELWVIKGDSPMHDPNNDKLSNEDSTAMSNFIDGFIAARLTHRPKRR